MVIVCGNFFLFHTQVQLHRFWWQSKVLGQTFAINSWQIFISFLTIDWESIIFVFLNSVFDHKLFGVHIYTTLVSSTIFTCKSDWIFVTLFDLADTPGINRRKLSRISFFSGLRSRCNSQVSCISGSIWRLSSSLTRVIQSWNINSTVFLISCHEGFQVHSLGDVICGERFIFKCRQKASHVVVSRVVQMRMLLYKRV